MILLCKVYNKAPLNNTSLRETNLSDKKMKSKGINKNKIGKSNQSLLQGEKKGDGIRKDYIRGFKRNVPLFNQVVDLEVFVA